MRECGRETIGKGHFVLGFEVAGLSEIPIGINELNPKIAKLLDTCIGISGRSLPGDDVPDFTTVYDRH